MTDRDVVRTPNVSQYIANLNTIPSPTDTEHKRDISLDDDLALFTDTQFFDFDMGQFGDVTEPVEYDPVQEQQSRRQHAAAKTGLDQSFDFANAAFQVPDVQAFPNINTDTSIINPALPQTSSYQYPDLSSPTSLTSPSVVIGPLKPGEKRKHDALDTRIPLSVEEASRLAAEEDKRRRNTAASARFRIKKKQREQALEKTAKEMAEKVSNLEARINQLEMENKWLKSLITEKNDNNEGMADLYRKFTKEHSEARSSSERKNGVGTANNEKSVKDEKSSE